MERYPIKRPAPRPPIKPRSQQAKSFSLMDVTPFHPDDIRKHMEDMARCQKQINLIGK